MKIAHIAAPQTNNNKKQSERHVPATPALGIFKFCQFHVFPESPRLVCKPQPSCLSLPSRKITGLCHYAQHECLNFGLSDISS